MKQKLPDRGDRDQRCNIGKECERSEYPSSEYFLIQNDSKCKRCDHCQRHCSDTIDYRILKCCLKKCISPQSFEIIYSLKRHRIGAVPFHKCKCKRKNDRDQCKHAETDEVRCDERISDQIASGLSADPSPASEFIDPAVVFFYVKYQFFLLSIILLNAGSLDRLRKSPLQFIDLSDIRSSGHFSHFLPLRQVRLPFISVKRWGLHPHLLYTVNYPAYFSADISLFIAAIPSSMLISPVIIDP